MTDYYVGIGGADGNSGLTWALRKLTLGGAEAVPVAAGDDVYVGPGVYREDHTTGVAGGNTYNAGTVTVTNGSTTVTGAGTAFVANVAAADMFHVQFFATGADGVANGTATFTSAAGNFQANMVGKIIQIMTRGAYVIGAVAAANSITLTDPNGLGWPAAAVGLTYSVMAGEGPYEIDSITDNTNFELVRDWCGPTLTGLAYLTYRPIRFIADVSGEKTDGVGGIVRLTGSDDDLIIARNNCISASHAYRLWRGFQLDNTTQHTVLMWADHLTLEDCIISGSSQQLFQWVAGTENATIRRCHLYACAGAQIGAWSAGTVNDTGHVVENCHLQSTIAQWGIYLVRVGGITVRNCLFNDSFQGVRVPNALAVGQTIDVRNNIFTVLDTGVQATVVGEITENNNLFGHPISTQRVNTAIGAGSRWGVVLLRFPPMLNGYKYPSWWFGELSEWSLARARSGAFEACDDFFGRGRPVTSAKNSYGPYQFTNMERDTGTVYAGAASMELLDAGRIQFKVPCTNRAYMVRVRVQREANYAGTNPQLVIKQPGQADRTTTDVGAAGAWNLLEDTFTPAADPEYFIVELVSNNTAVAGNYATYFDDLEIRGEPQQPGEFEHWLWDRQPFEVLPATALVVRGREYRRRRMPGEVSAMEEQ